MSFSRLKTVLLLLLTITIFASCRFTVPNASDNRALVKKRAFPAGVPPWAAQADADRPQLRANAGLVPQSFSVPAAVSVTRSSVPTAASQLELRQESEATGDILAADEAAIQEKERSDSPLDRIEQVCPGIEDGVTEALKTTDTASRVRQYESLTTRCPNSWDLWLWLAKDYESTGRYVEANRSLERVLTLNRTSEAAQALLSVVRRKLAPVED